MSKWLSKAVNVFKREGPEQPQPFQLACECGQQHSGLRRQRFQNIICKSCGASLFVLPRDVYPAPVGPVTREPPKRSIHVSEDAETEDELIVPPVGGDEPPGKLFRPSASTPLPRPKPTKRAKQRQAERELERERQLAAEQAERKLPTWIQQVPGRIANRSSRALASFRAFWKPRRIVAVVLLGAIAVALTLMIQQARTTRAVATARDKSDSGLRFIRDQQWVEARSDLAQAVQALDRLGRRDPESQTVRQYHRELEAYAGLSNLTLFDLVHEARDALSRGDQAAWKAGFPRTYAGDWMVFEGLVRRTAPASGEQPAEYELRIPWIPGAKGESVAVRADFPIFDEALNAATPLIFAGQLRSCERRGSVWEVTLDPRTGFLWSHPETYRELGMGNDPLREAGEVEAQLARQARIVGETP